MNNVDVFGHLSIKVTNIYNLHKPIDHFTLAALNNQASLQYKNMILDYK